MWFASRSFHFVFLFCAAGAISVLQSGCTRTDKPERRVLRIPSFHVKSLDPAFADDVSTAGQVALTYEGLLQYHYLKRPYVVTPNLAESLPEVSNEGRTLIFHLKKGILFQDSPAFEETDGRGRELIAEDVVYSLKRIADPLLKSPGWWLLDGRVEGLNQWRAQVLTDGKADYSKEISGLKVLDRYTIRIQLSRSHRQFLYAFATPYFSVVAKEAVVFFGEDFFKHPVGTGPFELKKWSAGSRLVWERNPTFRRELFPSEGSAEDRSKGLLEDAGQPLPLVDQVEVEIYREAKGKWANFLDHRLDWVEVPKENYSEAITSGKELVGELTEKGIKLSKTPRFDIVFEAFNLADPVFGKNRALRQALSLAYPSELLADLFYSGRAIPAQSPVPPGMPGFLPSYKNPYRQFNVTKAKALLAKAGFPEGKGLAPIKYATLDSAPDLEKAKLIAESFKELGVKLEVQGYSPEEFDSAIRRGEAQLWSGAWVADYPDAENFFQLFYGKNVSTGSNQARYQNPEFDALYEKITQGPLASVGVEGAKSERFYAQLTSLLATDCPWLFGVHRVGYFLTHSRLRNFKPHHFEHAAAKYYRVDTAPK